MQSHNFTLGAVQGTPEAIPRLLHILNEGGVSDTELARLFHVDRSTVRRWHDGSRPSAKVFDGVFYALTGLAFTVNHQQSQGSGNTLPEAEMVQDDVVEPARDPEPTQEEIDAALWNGWEKMLRVHE